MGQTADTGTLDGSNSSDTYEVDNAGMIVVRNWQASADEIEVVVDGVHASGESDTLEPGAEGHYQVDPGTGLEGVGCITGLTISCSGTASYSWSIVARPT